MAQQPPQPPLQEESVDRIRDIIFGPKMRDYEQRFEAMVRDLGRLQGELDRLGEQLAAKDAAQAKQLQAARQEARQADGELRGELKAEAARLAGQLSEQQTAQSTAVQAVRQELGQVNESLQASLKAEIAQLGSALEEQDRSEKDALQALRQELRAADTGLRDELRAVVQRLTEDKTDRSTLGELFIELGSHIKGGGSLNDLLQGLDLPS